MTSEERYQATWKAIFKNLLGRSEEQFNAWVGPRIEIFRNPNFEQASPCSYIAKELVPTQLQPLLDGQSFHDLCCRLQHVIEYPPGSAINAPFPNELNSYDWKQAAVRIRDVLRAAAIDARARAMTGQEWLTSIDLAPMFEFLEGKASERKLLLFNVACYYRSWDRLHDERMKPIIPLVEQFVDGLISYDQLDAVYFKAFAGDHSFPRAMGCESAFCGAMMLAEAATDPAGEEAAQATLLREIFGNPFRPVTVDPTWLIPTVTTLARMIYDDRSFEQMPKLADALETAGCRNEDILFHCHTGNHVRGCWVVDLLLGKE